MGLMRFLIPQRDHVADHAAGLAHLTAADGAAWRSRVVWTDDGLIVDRPVGDSGNFHIPWRTAKHGELTLSTASLMERSRPYHLPVELARGTLNRIRNQLAVWETAGMVVPPEATDTLAQAMQFLAKATAGQGNVEQSASDAAEAIDLSLDAIETLCDAYCQQALATRLQDAENCRRFSRPI